MGKTVKMSKGLTIDGKSIGAAEKTYIVAEVSANHNQDFDRAVKIIEAAKDAGADAVKFQTYTPDTLTIDCDNRYFRIQRTIWEGKTLYDLYGEAYTPWEWQPELKAVANGLEMAFFSTPFDASAVDFLEQMDVPAYKIASFELVDLPLLKIIADTRKPIILSTGMARLAEIDEAVRTIRNQGVEELALLKCTSAYPALPEDMNIRTIPHMAETFNAPVGLSDHTMGIAAPVAAVTLGACIVEKHLTLSRSEPGPDSAFSMEPPEFKEMVDAIRITEKALGRISYEPSVRETESRVFRRSLFVVRDMRAGEIFTGENIRSIRPGNGLSPKYLDLVLGKRATKDVKRGTPLEWTHIGEG
jgi:pseudaminic acid synthase